VRAPAVDLDEAPGARLAAVLLHPHPDMGGDRFNHVVDALFRALPRSGYSAARFDFRSADLATASAETMAAIAQLDAGRVALIGYSFGAGVALHVTDPRVAGWALIAPYAQDGGAVADDPRPKLVLAAEYDQWFPPSAAEPLVATWANATVVTVARADHFLAGGTGAVVDATLHWLDGLLTGPP
jgi:alpha/beta superfamily hydrolase